MRLPGSSLPSMLAAAATLVLSAPASAQQSPEATTPPEREEAAHGRTLNGHTFIPSSLVPNPFVVTSFGSNTGVGIARVSAGASASGTALSLGALSLGFDAQFGLTDWLALRTAITGSATSGIDLNGALNYGANVSYQVAAGLTFSLAYNNWLRMGFAVDAQYQPDYQFNIFNAINNSVMAGRVTAQTLLDNHQVLNLGGAWQAAIAVHKSLGFYLDLRYMHTLEKLNDNATNSGNFSTGLALSFDLNAISPLPLGILAAYRVTAPTSGASAIQDVSAGIFYSGRRNLVLGPEAAITLLPGASTSSVLIVQGVIVLRYYW